MQACPDVWHHVRSGVCVSAFPKRFNEDVFSPEYCVRVPQLASGFLSEGIVPFPAIHSVFLWEDGSLGTFCDHLGGLLLIYIKVTYLNSC